ncbi:hypothetical protein V2J91_23770 [Pseudomonas alliivorans]|nr:hypothetical protein [Pseudomonas alliivorans]
MHHRECITVVLTAMHHRYTLMILNNGDAPGGNMKVREMAQVIFRAEPEIKEWLEKKAKQEQRSQNWLVGKALREAMRRDEQINQA